jgi:hypothetical protein
LELDFGYSQIAQAAGTSDTGLKCDLTSPDGSKCEAYSINVYPNNGISGLPSVYQGFDVQLYSSQPTFSPLILKNESHDLTAAVIHGSIRSSGSDTNQSIFTMNEQPIPATGSTSCGYISPLLNSQYNQGRVIPFKFVAVTPPNTCPSGPSFMTNLHARLELVQLTNLSTGDAAAPHRVDFTLSNGTQCTESLPCFYRLDPSSNNWILNVDTSSLQGGGTIYLGTTFDDSNQIPSFSVTQGQKVDFFTVN